MFEHLSPEEFVYAIGEHLGLQYEAQDWGFVNANGSRFDDFVRFFVDHAEKIPAEKYHLFMYCMTELVLHSAEELLEDRDIDEVQIESLTSFWTRVKSHHAGQMMANELRRGMSDGTAQRGTARLFHLLGLSA